MRTTKPFLSWISVFSAAMALCTPGIAAAAGNNTPAPRTATTPSAPRPDRSFKVGPVEVLVRKQQVAGAPGATKASVSSGITFKGRGFVVGKYEKMNEKALNGTAQHQTTQYAVTRETGTHVKIAGMSKEISKSQQQGIKTVKLPFGFVAPKAATPTKPQ